MRLRKHLRQPLEKEKKQAYRNIQASYSQDFQKCSRAGTLEQSRLAGLLASFGTQTNPTNPKCRQSLFLVRQ